MTFAEKLVELRKNVPGTGKDGKMTQEELAAESGLPLGSIRNYEQGQRQPLWNVVPRLARALGVDCTAFADCVEDAAQVEPVREKSRTRKRK